jgi:hypothetical protein
MSACIIAAQVVMVPVALASSRLAETWGRRPTFLIGFAVLPIRGLLYTLTNDPFWLVAIQLLDGIGAGIFGVVGVLVIADLTRGTGRFNLMQGALATATGIGGSASLYLTGGHRRPGTGILWDRHAGDKAGCRSQSINSCSNPAHTSENLRREGTSPPRFARLCRSVEASRRRGKGASAEG